MKLIEVQNITKKYANHTALKNVTFSIETGTIFGLLGPNGAGKTSLIRILNQISYPDEGQILFNGHILSPKDVESVGYLPEERGLYKKMKVGEEALYLAQLKGVPKRTALERLHYMFRKFEIESWWDKKVEELSKGMQQKVQFITTIIHKPSLLILDEPFSGFDPINTNIIKEEIIKLKEQGTTIILSTHNMTSVEEICNDIVLINKSQKVLEGNVAQLRQQYKTHQFNVEIDRTDIEIPENFGFKILAQKEEYNRTLLTLQLTTEYNSNQLLTQLMPYGNITNFQEILPSMNEIFIQAVNENRK